MQPAEAAVLDKAVVLGQARHAGPGRGHKTIRNTNGFRRHDDASYIRAKLVRDGFKAELAAKNTDLVNRVLKEISERWASVKTP
jgi:hypothetical protein